MKISVVTSLYMSSEYINEFYSRVEATLLNITSDFEVIFVNDCSPDDSIGKVLALKEKVKDKLKVIDLSINSGQHKALMTGLMYATGDIIFMMDSDLEENPEDMALFYQKYKEENEQYDVIYGVQNNRKGNIFERLSGYIFYWLLNLLADISIPQNPTPFRLMTKRYVDELVKFKEREVFFLGISLLAGFNQLGIPLEKKSESRTSYSLRKKVNQFIDAVTSFSSKPLVFVFYIGTIMSSSAFIYIFYLVCGYFIYGIGVEGWTTVVVSIWLVGGVIIFCIGLVGIYLSRIFKEVKQRPYTVVRKFYE